MANTSTNNFSHNIKLVREVDGLSQSAFADKIGSTRGAVSQYEIGGNLPKHDVLTNIEMLYGLKKETLTARKLAFDDIKLTIENHKNKTQPFLKSGMGLLQKNLFGEVARIETLDTPFLVIWIIERIVEIQSWYDEYIAASNIGDTKRTDELLALINYDLLQLQNRISRKITGLGDVTIDKAIEQAKMLPYSPLLDDRLNKGDVDKIKQGYAEQISFHQSDIENYVREIYQLKKRNMELERELKKAKETA